MHGRADDGSPWSVTPLPWRHAECIWTVRGVCCSMRYRVRQDGRYVDCI
jgi:hypothetical protein